VPDPSQPTLYISLPERLGALDLVRATVPLSTLAKYYRALGTLLFAVYEPG
jgi:hypothetical protein